MGRLTRTKKLGTCPLKLLAPVVLTLVVLSPCVVPAAAGQQNVLPPPSSIYGHSYQEWAAAWWQWALTQPVATNPVLDEDGRNCAAGQIGPVWFLAGTFQSGVRVERSCEVPAGTALFFPVVNSFYCAIAAVDPPETRTEAYARSQVSFVRDAANGLVATIDGVAVPNIKPRYFEESVLFDVVLPADNLFELDPGTLLDPCVDAGYYLMLHPLSVGEHTIAFSGSLGAFTIDVEYTITVVGGRR